MTTEKFICQKCTCICLLSVSFTEGDEKTKSALTCPLRFTYHDFHIVDKSPERAIIQTEFPTTQEQLTFLKRRSAQLDHLKRLMKDCSKCIHSDDLEYCFGKCRVFSEYMEKETMEQAIKKQSIYERGNA